MGGGNCCPSLAMLLVYFHFVNVLLYYILKLNFKKLNYNAVVFNLYNTKVLDCLFVSSNKIEEG